MSKKHKRSVEPPRRKGATRVADVPPAVLRRLNAGEIESVTLAELLAMDLGKVLKAVVPSSSASDVSRLREGGIVQRMAAGGAVLMERLGPDAAERFAGHPSDVVRAWAAYAIGLDPKGGLGRRLRRVRPLADDPNAGVREWAWMAVRPHIATEVDEAVALLTPWTTEASPNLRRFASEATRPRGVWCAHIHDLRDSPQRGLPILEPLRADPHKYVQNSVANWLNDAGKSHPDWLLELCKRWRRQSPGEATEKIVKRATRNLRKP